MTSKHIPITPAQIRAALITSAATNDVHVSAAVGLLANHNHGRITEDTGWLDAFVHVSRSGYASVDWDGLDAALDADDGLDRETREAVLPFSSTEKGVMRFACDLGMGRWGTSRWDVNTAEEVLDAFASAMVPGGRGGGVSNTLRGGVGAGSMVVQAGRIRF